LVPVRSTPHICGGDAHARDNAVFKKKGQGSALDPLEEQP